MKEKWLHVFTLDKTQKVKETTVDKDESGNEVQITKEVEKKIPQRFCILKPTRKIQDDSSIFYSVKVSEAIKLGLITKAFLLRKFQKDGVIASDEEKKEYTNNYSRAVMLEVEAEKIKNDSTLSEAEKDLKVANINDEYKSLITRAFKTLCLIIQQRRGLLIC
jgi:predicted transcriptional regulator